MTIIFPHANNEAIPLVKFVAGWKVWFERFPENPEAWRTGAMPRLNRQENLQEQLDARRDFSLDVLCRYLVRPAYRNTMHATKSFVCAVCGVRFDFRTFQREIEERPQIYSSLFSESTA